MLLDRVSTTQSFSDFDVSEESFSPAEEGSNRAGGRIGNSADRPDAMAPGDEVVFARLDVAEALGIWRHARGRVIETHHEARAAMERRLTVDVKFEGHDTLHRYLPDLFERRTT